MLKTTIQTFLIALSAACFRPNAAAADSLATVVIDAAAPKTKVSPSLYGLFFEEINCAGDGGIYAELIRNRSFEDAENPRFWELDSGKGKATISIEPATGPSEHNKRVLKL